jgi:hypothetical protein
MKPLLKAISPVAKTYEKNGGADAMKRSCSDTLMYFNTALRPSSERHHRLDPHLCVQNIVLCRIRRLFIASALPFMKR